MRGSSISGLRKSSDHRRHPGGLGALGALGDFVTNTLAFLQAKETGCINRAVMDEHVRTSIFGCDDAESLRVVEPLHCAVLHELPPRLDTNARARFRSTRMPSMQSNVANLQRSYCRSISRRTAGTAAEATSTLSSASCRVISATAPPQPAAQLATMAMQADSSPSSRASAASGLPALPTNSHPAPSMRATPAPAP